MVQKSLKFLPLTPNQIVPNNYPQFLKTDLWTLRDFLDFLNVVHDGF